MGKRYQREEANEEEKRIEVDDTDQKANPYIVYYKLQNIIHDNDAEQFYQMMKTDLSITFRINESSPYKNTIIQELQTRFHFDDAIQFEGNEIHCVHPLTWYKEHLIWEIHVQRKKLKKIPQLKELHSYLIDLNENGLIQREELVSMLPPLFLAPSKDDIILDMCASPGSKTFHLMEMLHDGSGCVVANEANMNRIGMLINHTSCIPSNRIAVTHCLAQEFPLNTLPYDKVLCDVPCSGDGTLRKNPMLWSSWNLKYSFLLHPLQISILMRGLQCVKKGGCVVYSTCSLNPIENEAVIAAVLCQTEGKVKLKDLSHQFPLLKRQPGLHTWKVVDDSQHIYDSVPRESSIIQASCFPPDPSQSQIYHLERCMRFLPHQNNSGGFFIAVLEKVDELEGIASQPLLLNGSLKTEQEIMKKKTKKERVFPFNNRDLSNQLSSFFGLEAFDWSSVFVKNENHHDLYVVAHSLQSLLQVPEETISFISTGIKIFEFNNSSTLCPYKICQDGLEWVVPHMKKRIIRVSKEELVTVLKAEKGCLMLNACPLLAKQLDSYEEGCCVLQFDTIYCSVWRSKKSVQLLIKQSTIKSILRRIE